MRAALLPSLRGEITNGQQLRREVAKAIGEVETYARRASAEPASADALIAFFAAATTAVQAAMSRPASIVITPSTITLSLAGTTTQQLTVTVTKLDGTTANWETAAEGTTYTSSDPTKATVGVDGLVTAVAAGTTTITAFNGNKSATKLVTVTA